MKESEVLKIEESESELLCTDSRALILTRNLNKKCYSLYSVYVFLAFLICVSSTAVSSFFA
jgi:hypothetical protein